MTFPEIHGYEVWVRSKPDWARVVNAKSRGASKYDYWLDLTDAWPDVPFTEIRCRKVGGPQTSANFVRNAQYRGRPDLKCGSRVVVGGKPGVIVGHNSSANFVVCFGDHTGSAHPDDLKP